MQDTEQRKQAYQRNKLAKRLRRLTSCAIDDFQMIEAGDRIMVCLSGGKDSHTLLDMLLSLQKSAPIEFSLLAVHLNQKQPGYRSDILPPYLEANQIPYRIVEQDTYSIVKRIIPEGKTSCSLCSRLRRGILYRIARQEGATKIALGHHRDDLLETLLLNLFYTGKLKSMSPKFVSDNGEHRVIRPLAYCREKDIAQYAALKHFPIIPCTLCNTQANLQREIIGDMLKTWDKRYPGRLETMFTALQNIIPSHLCDRHLYDFGQLTAMRSTPYAHAAPVKDRRIPLD